MQYLITIPLAVLPSVVWLLWYLRKDRHPEPKRMIVRVFIWGMLIAFPAILVENAGIGILNALALPLVLTNFLVYFVVVAITEEVLKFLVVHFRVLQRTHQLDEPVDAMIYMIAAALGFAAIENIFLLTPLFEKDFVATLHIAFSRFVGATLLHALASGIIGYYLALRIFKAQKKFPPLIHGFVLAILLHGFYNILVIQTEEQVYFVLPVALLVISAVVLVSLFFRSLLKMNVTT